MQIPENVLVKLGDVKLEHLQGFAVGYAVGICYMGTLVYYTDKARLRTFNRSNALAKRLLKEAWVYLPPEVKDTFQDEIKFYNIAIEEDF